MQRGSAAGEPSGPFDYVANKAAGKANFLSRGSGAMDNEGLQAAWSMTVSENCRFERNTCAGVG